MAVRQGAALLDGQPDGVRGGVAGGARRGGFDSRPEDPAALDRLPARGCPAAQPAGRRPQLGSGGGCLPAGGSVRQRPRLPRCGADRCRVGRPAARLRGVCAGGRGRCLHAGRLGATGGSPQQDGSRGCWCRAVRRCSQCRAAGAVDCGGKADHRAAVSPHRLPRPRRQGAAGPGVRAYSRHPQVSCWCRAAAFRRAVVVRSACLRRQCSHAPAKRHLLPPSAPVPAPAARRSACRKRLQTVASGRMLHICYSRVDKMLPGGAWRHGEEPCEHCSTLR